MLISPVNSTLSYSKDEFKEMERAEKNESRSLGSGGR